MKLCTHKGEWIVTDGDEAHTFNSSAEAWHYIFNNYKKEINA